MARILVIDDNDKFREMLRECLANEGYDVITAADGKEGSKIYREAPTDLVITDVLMPVKDGTETIFELKKDYPSMKVIVISGGGTIDAETYLDAITAYTDIEYTFTKPFDMDEMLAAVKEILS